MSPSHGHEHIRDDAIQRSREGQKFLTMEWQLRFGEDDGELPEGRRIVRFRTCNKRLDLGVVDLPFLQVKVVSSLASH